MNPRYMIECKKHPGATFKIYFRRSEQQQKCFYFECIQCEHSNIVQTLYIEADFVLLNDAMEISV
jgi:hypothetical protein